MGQARTVRVSVYEPDGTLTELFQLSSRTPVTWGPPTRPLCDLFSGIRNAYTHTGYAHLRCRVACCSVLVYLSLPWNFLSLACFISATTIFFLILLFSLLLVAALVAVGKVNVGPVIWSLLCIEAGWYTLVAVGLSCLESGRRYSIERPVGIVVDFCLQCAVGIAGA